MGTIDSLAGHLRARARWRLDRVQSGDGEFNARCAVALLDAACFAETLPGDDPLVAALVAAGCFGPEGRDDFTPDRAAATIIDFWHRGEPRELLTAIPAASAGAPEPDQSVPD
ncbi:hypothetical protein Sru01_48340 [Sphaerisporangium rufum]|uniref:Uncharacterized protein n=1 Tax=Sphaerisporangium rufum TaxID=1381558 RepID=A0A919R9P5_9ACTN|nr:hypothetical protein [Sphaerisporangium rufum]GII79852.1 hypothetical protein Sru01_48340 [Sphaerisporangium rufum]